MYIFFNLIYLYISLLNFNDNHVFFMHGVQKSRISYDCEISLQHFFSTMVSWKLNGLSWIRRSGKWNEFIIIRLSNGKPNFTEKLKKGNHYNFSYECVSYKMKRLF